MSTISVRIPDSLYEFIKKTVQRENISINQFIVSALGEKISSWQTESYLKNRAKNADKNQFRKALSQISDREPEDFDKL